MSEISIDIYGELPPSKWGKKYVLGIRCNYTKYTEYHAMRSITTAAVAEILFREIICRHGAIRRIHSDNGQQFSSLLNRVLCDLTNTRKTFSSTYYPQGNSSIEKSFATLTIGLFSLARKNRADWCQYLPCIGAAFNSAWNETIGDTPYRMLYGHDYETPMLVNLGVPPLPCPRAKRSIMRTSSKEWNFSGARPGSSTPSIK